MNRIIFAIALPLFGLAGTGAAADVVISCKADFSPLAKPGDTAIIHVQIVKNADNTLAGLVNNRPWNKNVEVTDYSVRENLDLNADPYADGFNYNEAEKALLHMSVFVSEPELAQIVKLPFKITDVKKVRIYDVMGNSFANKFGGEILIEAYDIQGRLLGRAFRAVFVNGCF